jgi:hypothetical protein
VCDTSGKRIEFLVPLFKESRRFRYLTVSLLNKSDHPDGNERCQERADDSDNDKKRHCSVLQPLDFIDRRPGLIPVQPEQLFRLLVDGIKVFFDRSHRFPSLNVTVDSG